MASLYLGDCHEIVARLPRHDALVSDPPYGQNAQFKYGGGIYRSGKLEGLRRDDYCTRWPPVIGDAQPFDPGPWIERADICLLWGAHKFADRLPPGQFLVWDKQPNGKLRSQGDGEVAWLNSTKPLRVYRLLWDGWCVGKAEQFGRVCGRLKREHPTQKPVSLMAWCLRQAGVRAGMSVIDPWMGAGSTGVAAVQAGCRFTGVEIEPAYFEAACRRLHAAQNSEGKT